MYDLIITRSLHVSISSAGKKSGPGGKFEDNAFNASFMSSSVNVSSYIVVVGAITLFVGCVWFWITNTKE